MVGRGCTAIPSATDASSEKSGEISARWTGQGRRGSWDRQKEIARREKVGCTQASMSAVTIYHNPRCSTSRKTLEMIRAKGIEPTIIEYLKTPPSASELDRILSLLKIEPRELMRKKEEEYKTLKLDRQDLTRKDLIKAMVDHPILIERPIVLSKGKAALGRPPENVTSIL
jgi:arsenate reductase